MRGGLEAGAVGAGDDLGVLLRRVVQLPVVAAVGGVPLGEVRGPAAECPVGVELDALDTEKVVAEAVHHAQVERGVEEGGGEVGGDAHAQGAVGAGAQIRLHLAAGRLGVADGGDSGGEEDVLGALEVVGHDGVGLGEVEVRAVVADFYAAGAGEQIAGGVPELAVGLAGGEAADAAALGVGGARGDAAGAQGVGVDDAAVAGGVHHVHLAVGGDAVQVVAGGVAALGEPHGCS